MNTCDAFLAQCLAIDLEIGRDGRLWQIGALFGNQNFERKNIDFPEQALAELDTFAGGARFVLGHNILNHDLPILQNISPELRLHKLPVVDTLYLSPLAFPQNPYHRLVKDYKLIKDSINDPVADARLAVSVFKDQWVNFLLLRQNNPELPGFYRFCFEGSILGSAAGGGVGMAVVFAALGADALSVDEASPFLLNFTKDCACQAALRETVFTRLIEPDQRPALAYVVSWLGVAGGNSVLPPWVRYCFSQVMPILKELRDRPCGDVACPYCAKVHNPVTQLNEYFRYPGFRTLPDGRPLQEEIVIAGMRGTPLLGILPTGGGKSLCYQMPALSRYFRRGVLTIVISPLQALMKDQVDNLIRKTDTNAAAAIYGMLTPPERGEILNRVRLGDIGILYISPEQLRNRSLREAIKYREIGCWVFDEAHCLSKWGHDFRPDYLYVARFIREFAAEQEVPIPSVACYTATAKPDVIAEISDHFRKNINQKLVLYATGTERQNLHFEVHYVKREEKYSRLDDLLRERLLAKPPTGSPDRIPAGAPDNSSLSGSAIVYCAFRKTTEEYAEFLRLKGWRAEPFHAGLDAPRKRQIQEEFISGDIPVICATSAFGMGIDKPDVRLVVHADIPGSLENYLQEAGRAGRDEEVADCILLYDKEDIESQFKISAITKLSRRDISQILRGLRNMRRNLDNEVIITAGELLREDKVETSFDTGRQADTKVRTAVAWLERAGYVERNANRTQVFQGKPLFKSLHEAQARLDKLNLPVQVRKQWEIILEALINSDPDEGLSADDLAELPGICPQVKKKADDRKEETPTQKVLRILHAMAEAGLIKKGLQLTAYLRPKGRNNAHSVFTRITAIEKDMLQLMQEDSPDADQGKWQHLSLRMLNQRLIDSGHRDSNPEILRNLLTSLAMDGKGLAGSRGSIECRYLSQDKYLIKLQRDWQSLLRTAELRIRVAGAILEELYRRIPPEYKDAREMLLLDFAGEDLVNALRQDLFLGAQVRDELAAVDRGLMFLHEQKAIILQHGLAVFRQAMTIRILPESKKRRYSKADYQPLAHHYKERIFQIHVMNEYARLGINKLKEALALILAYFTLSRRQFITRFFGDDKDMLARATSRESYRCIVESVANPAQEAVIAAPPDANLLVLAGPGAGKTKVVVHRCAYLLKVERVPAKSILVLCFNHSAKIILRKRLTELAGKDAAGVAVLTYHGLAMRLTGASFAVRSEELSRDLDVQQSRFDNLIPEALALLRGEREIPGLESDALRDRLLSGYQYILVDEYQDIDQEQYDLISALAGRKRNDPDSRLSILAVGDDDQSIYGFRRANIRFIKQFAEDYRAAVHYLVENYRSSKVIIKSANELIARNRDRMKTDQPIIINRARKYDKAGGAWTVRDSLVKGRVQVVKVETVEQQAVAAAVEIKRLMALGRQSSWSDFAVLARNGIRFEELASFKAMLDKESIPVMWNLDREQGFRLHRVREVIRFLDELDNRKHETATASRLIDLAAELAPDEPTVWQNLLMELLDLWQQESGDHELPVSQAREFLFETLAEQQREHKLGQGVFLSTVHGAKGLEFPHVLILDGKWSSGRNRLETEEERRLYYVAMTRAGETLTLFKRLDCRNPHLSLVMETCFSRTVTPVVSEHLKKILNRRYELISFSDLYLDYPARFPAAARIHEALTKLRAGDPLELRPESKSAREERINIHNSSSEILARLSLKGTERWKQRLSFILQARVLAVMRRYSEDSQKEFQKNHRCDSWEVPIIEVVYAEPSFSPDMR